MVRMTSWLQEALLGPVLSRAVVACLAVIQQSPSPLPLKQEFVGCLASEQVAVGVAAVAFPL